MYEAINVIVKHLNLNEIEEFLDHIINKLASENIHHVNTALKIIDRTFKHYRYEVSTDELYAELHIVISKLGETLFRTFCNTINMHLIEVKNNDSPSHTLKVLYESMVLISNVFFSLNAQDLPTLFESNMEAWMVTFHLLLTSDFSVLRNPVRSCEY